MHDSTTIYLFIGIAAFLILVIAPLRTMAAWLVTSCAGPLFGILKVGLHILVSAHWNVIRNFAPRRKIIYELDHKRTSHTDED